MNQIEFENNTFKGKGFGFWYFKNLKVLNFGNNIINTKLEPLIME